MGRPRRHDRDALLDAARALWVEHGVAGVTIRALSAASGVSNGAIYHAFGSRDGLLARVWAREASAFLAHQRAAAEQALAAGTAADAVVAAALAPATYAATDEQGARLLLAVTPDQLRRGELPEEQRAELAATRRALHALIVGLADALWKRDDPAALATVSACLVELPAALLLERRRLDDPVARRTLELAVRGVLSTPPPGRA